MQLRVLTLLFLMITLSFKAHADPQTSAELKTDDVDISHYKVRCNAGVFDLCGYFDLKRFKDDSEMEWLIKPAFEQARDFSEGLAPVKKNEKYGFIDTSGKFKIEPQFEAVGLFHEGLAPFYQGQKIGFIDKSGKIIVPAIFQRAVSINGNTIIGRDSGKPARSARRPLRSLSDRYKSELFSGRSGNMGIYVIGKGWVTDQIFSFRFFDKESFTLFWAQKTDEEKSGLMRLDGSWHTNQKYWGVSSLDEGLATFKVKQKNGEVLTGAVNEKGELAIPAKFEWVGRWSGDFGVVGTRDYKTRKYGIINREGDLLGERYFDEVQQPGVYFTTTETVFLPRIKIDEKWFSLTLEGKLIDDQKKADELNNGPILDCENFTLNRTESGANAKDKFGTIIAEFDYERSLSFFIGPHTTNSAHRCDAPFWISSKGKYSFILPEGTFFAGQFFDQVAPIFENVAAFSKDGKRGLIDAKGNVIVEPKYDSIRWYGDERFVVRDSNGNFLLDKHGKRYELADDPNYNAEYNTKLPPREDYLKCGGEAKLISKAGKWGLVDQDGKTILTPKYKALICYRDGFAWAPRDELQKWCPIDRHGNYAVDEELCSVQRYPKHRWHYFPEKRAESGYESSVIWNLEYLNYGAGRRSAPPVLAPDGVSTNKPILMGPGWR